MACSHPAVQIMKNFGNLLGVSEQASFSLVFRNLDEQYLFLQPF